MSIPGPKPKPAELAEKQGNPGHRPIVKPLAATASASDVMPLEWLDAEGREIWNLYAPGIGRLGFFRNSDRMAFARLCDYTARWLRLRKNVNERGESYTTTSNHGTMERFNPAFRAMLNVESILVALEDRFGLTPSARQQILTRIGDTPPPPDNPMPMSNDQAETDSLIGMFAQPTDKATAH